MESILFVDDEPKILDAFRRQLYKKYDIRMAHNGKEALEYLASSEPVPVIVSDLKMPEMDGIQFFSKVKEIAPESVRILLTGHADLSTAIEAINEGKIFQFLTKPCPQKKLVEAIQAGLDHYHAVTQEQRLMEQTHEINLRLLTEILILTNPAAYNRSIRIRKIVNRIVSNLSTTNAWEYQLAAMLCQIGCIALSPSLYDKALSEKTLSPREASLYTSHPMIGFRLLENISRLGGVAKMIRDQDRNYASFIPNGQETVGTALGSQILKVAGDYDKLVLNGMTHTEAVDFMAELEQIYYPRLIRALGSDEILAEGWDVILVDHEELEAGMLLRQDIVTKLGALFVPKDRILDSLTLEKIQDAAHQEGIVEPIQTLVRASYNDVVDE